MKSFDPPPDPPVRSKRILGNNSELFKALESAGIADSNTRRVVIDIAVDSVVKVFVEKYADARIINVVTELDGVHIRSITAPKCTRCGHMINQHNRQGCIHCSCNN
jgi:hypothetical protein